MAKKRNNKRKFSKKKAPTKPVKKSSQKDAPTSASTKIRRPRNKQKVLVVASRGITSRHRHLMEDIHKLLPHSKKENKFDTKNDPSVLNEIAELRNCSSCIYFEERKRKDLYMWISLDNGPSLKCHVVNVHTMDELKMAGNHLMGSRPILSFDDSFQQTPHHRLLQEMFTKVFGTPRFHPASKPFVDHVFSFSLVDNKVWFRNYQIVDRENQQKKKPRKGRRKEGDDEEDDDVEVEGGEDEVGQLSAATGVELIEVGPRFVMDPIRIFDDSFGGETIFKNGSFITPNKLRAYAKKSSLLKYADRKHEQKHSKRRREEAVVPQDEFDSVFE